MSLATGTLAANPFGSAAVARATIAEALQTVEALHAYLFAPDNITSWDAYPRWAGTDYRGGRLQQLGVPEYDAIVVLPAGYEPDTVAQGDSLLDQVVSALWSVGVIQTAYPIQLTLNNGSAVPALSVRVVPHLHN